jgi:hypothetical protein
MKREAGRENPRQPTPHCDEPPGGDPPTPLPDEELLDHIRGSCSWGHANPLTVRGEGGNVNSSSSGLSRSWSHEENCETLGRKTPSGTASDRRVRRAHGGRELREVRGLPCFVRTG